jgi:phosphate transport system substrate-binding protein
MTRRYIKTIFFLGIIALLVVTCNKKEGKETILEGKATILTDETLTPIVEDQIMVFESEYNAKITLVSKSEAEAVNALLDDSAKIAILSRQLTSEEMTIFEKKKIIPKTTKFATDGIAFITNKSSKDTLIALSDVLDFIRGKQVAGIKGLAFDNPNSSTVRHLNELAGVKTSPSKEIYSFHNNTEAIKYIAEHDGIIGVIGLNWLSQPTPEMAQYLGKVTIMSVKGKDKNYYFPSQNNIAEGKYPLARDLFVVNCQGFSGLGMGFASFVAGERGQRIILKSGLLPAKIPGRKILIKEDNKDK